MSNIAIIPSRYASTRFPGKPLAILSGKPMIQWVYESCTRANELNGVYVATDDERIYDCVIGFGGMAIMTSPSHTCGTDRLAECIEILKLNDDDTVLNIQGDEPLIDPIMVDDLVSIFSDERVYMGTLKKKIEDENELQNPNVVKVITDLNDDAIYFSRFCIPYERDKNEYTHYKHIGMYGYKTWFLKKYSRLPKSSLEKTESLEQLRVIENGYKIRVKETLFQTIGVDTPEQLNEVERRIIERSR